MFQFVDDTRRITTFIKTEAYKWLFNNLAKYEPKGTDAENLYMQINQNGAVTEDTYQALTKLFENNPFAGTIKGISHKKSITTNEIHMYFVEYNGTKLPIGFIFDFFEDDYGETDKDKERKLIADFLKDAKRETITKWESTKFNSRQKLEQTAKSLGNISNFGRKNYIKLGAWIVCWVVLLLSVLHFVNTYNVINTFLVLAENEWDFDQYLDFTLLDSNGADISEPVILNLEEPYNMSTYLQTIFLPLVVSFLATIFLVVHLFMFSGRLKNFVELLIIKCRFSSHNKVSEKCINTGSEEIATYLQDLAGSVDFVTRKIDATDTNANVVKIFVQLDKKNTKLEEKLDKYKQTNANVQKHWFYQDKENKLEFKITIRFLALLLVLALLVIVSQQPFVVNWWSAEVLGL
ncbi:MAG: hypothetical protein FWG68_10980 [Defluviitaleaceae bacterium]|nr:hypothetical protein [Defluviitaleaceae bacterium]